MTMMKFPFERKCMDIVGDNRNMMVPWYLMCSYAYYILDQVLVSDATYDAMCVMLDEEWDSVEHVHKVKIVRSHLKAGTCMIPRDQYPTIAKSATATLLGIRLPREDIPEIGFSRKLRDLSWSVETVTEAIRELR